MTDLPEDMTPDIEDGRIVSFPMRDFIEQGLLHMANREWFWPKGLMLTAAQWVDEGEMYRSSILPLLRDALDGSQVKDAIMEWVNAVGPTDRVAAIDSLAEAIWTAMSAHMKGVPAEGVVIRQYEPPEVIASGLGPVAQQARQQAFFAWLRERNEVLVK